MCLAIFWVFFSIAAAGLIGTLIDHYGHKAAVKHDKEPPRYDN